MTYNFVMSFLERVWSKVFGDPHVKLVRGLQPTVDLINGLEDAISGLSDDGLKAKTGEFKDRLANGDSLDDILPEAFAVVREASKRVLGMRHFDVQLVGGIVLHQGKIAEMKTGEGKTLVATLPSYLNALSGDGVYLVTVNDYLARRDSEWMGKIHTFLGLSVGLIQSGMDNEDRQAAYLCDIVYGTNNEYGFDYLRDNLASDIEEICQTRRGFAIVDEVDSILIDEARTPLIISGPIPDSTAKYMKVVNAVKKLKKEDDFTVDEKHKNVVLSDEGILSVEKALGVSNVYSTENMELAHMAVQCLKAMHVFKRDVDYVIRDNQVHIVDEFTGRVLEGRRYSDGLHQAIEAIERLPIKEESQTLASVTYQNYFRLFPKLAGMTGTAVTESEEFGNIYGLAVVVVPTNKPIARKDHADVVYKSRLEKYKAVAKEVKDRNKKGQPMLVGTISIESSEELSRMLHKEGVVHSVLNAKYHEKEAEIIAGAGQKGAVTIATNMAGRGTDIVLGEGVLDLGGLFVIGTERHESRRIDNQLRGRSGRQGDPGESRFFVGLDDDLMRLFGSDRIARVMETLGLPDDTPIEHGLISKSIERAQKKVEQHHFSIRKQILEYDNVMEKQRETVYQLRRDVLGKTGLEVKLKEGIRDVVSGISGMYGFPFGKEVPDEARGDFVMALKEIFPVSNMDEVVANSADDPAPISKLGEMFFNLFNARQGQYPEGLFMEAVKVVLLRALDQKWMDHLHNMDVLREGIGLRAYGQRDPLTEYKREAFEMFQELLLVTYEEALKVINRMELVNQEGNALEAPKVASVLAGDVSYEGGKAGRQKEGASPVKTVEKVGRNEACSCGSGKKFKKCCGA